MRTLANIQKLLLFSLAMLVTLAGLAQSAVTLSGKVKDKALKEFLPGAVITLKGASTFKTIADGNGNYLLVNVPKGKYELRVSYVNYKETVSQIEVSGSGIQAKDIEMESVSKVMNEVLV